MRKIFWVAPFLIHCGSVFAATITCPDPSKLAGTYKTSVQPGYTPNIFTIKAKQENREFHVDLTSYWAPKPFDNGERGSVGDFSGNLDLLEPWSCVGILNVKEEERHPDADPISCNLIFRFIGKSFAYVETTGQCEYFHGINAYPSGKYVKQK